VVFRPTVETRIACAVPGLILAWLAGYGALRAADGVAWAMAAPVVAAGLFWAVRCARFAVFVGASDVTVRGLVLARRVPRRAVEALRDGDGTLLFGRAPTLYWHDGSGRPRRTRMWMFGDPQRQFTDVSGHNRGTIRRLRKCLGISASGERRLRG
jgi:hypothetical protein